MKQGKVKLILSAFSGNKIFAIFLIDCKSENFNLIFVFPLLCLVLDAVHFLPLLVTHDESDEYQD
ncbi:hypothetical protein T4A_14326 [Trichinella pseudospiralis]|uniref:Uncharacterized protein n=1 Tax=Trichinella pseudospiralis TaxID=6337 RepID=A0A0V1EJ95_TRIPS|nr:hypothetical protein T4A_14326 [Trichinella pseudospiralis]